MKCHCCVENISEWTGFTSICLVQQKLRTTTSWKKEFNKPFTSHIHNERLHNESISWALSGSAANAVITRLLKINKI